MMHDVAAQPDNLSAREGAVKTDEKHSRRSHERIPTEAAVVLWVNSNVTDPHARTANISQDGMFVTTSYPLPVGTVARFEMSLPNGTVIRGFAEVIWLRPRFESVQKPNGMGFRYVVMRDDGQAQLRQFLATQVRGTPSNNARVRVKEQTL